MSLVALAQAVFTIVVAVLFGGFGAFLVVSGLRTIRTSDRRDEFEPVEARILESRVETRSEVSSGTRYSPVIEYEYSVGGTRYTNDNIYPGSVTRSNLTRDRPQAVVDRHDEGDRVEAYYDPADPTASFLVSKSTAGAGKGIIVAGGFCLVIALLIIVAVVASLL